METFTPLSATIGGMLIGLAAGLLWIVNGRIAGVSGIFGGLVPSRPAEAGWRLLFLIGLPLGAAIGFRLAPALFAAVPAIPPAPGGTALTLVAAGLLVGIGTRLSGGCTSGHGVCGLARLSPRSAAAVAVFMAAGAFTVFVTRHL